METIECLYCGRGVARACAKQYTCPTCYRAHVEAFGEMWYEQPWHKELLPDYAKFMRETERLSRALPIDSMPDIDPERVGQPVRLAPAANQAVFNAVKVVYIAHGGGARRIRRLLAERGVAPVVSERTIRRYLRAIRGELSDAA